MIENRKNQRFDLRLPFELIRNGQRSNIIQGKTVNLSSNGVMFESDQKLAVGEIIEYFVTLPTGQKLDEDVRLRCMGKIIRTHATFAAATMERYEFVRTIPLTGEIAVATSAAAS